MPPFPRLAIGLDVGGTKIAGGVVDAEGEVVERVPPIATSSTQDASIVDTLHRLAEGLRTRHPGIAAIGVGAAGLIDWPQGHIRWAPNNSYRQVPLRRLLQEATGLPAVVDNDANVAAWAETASGGRSGHMAFLTVGTGVGGGLVLNGELYRGKSGIAAEVGHMIVDPLGDYRCGCGNIGCLEAVASGTALGRYGRQAAEKDPDGLMARIAGGPAGVTGRIVFEAAMRGDSAARRQFECLGFWLGVGVASLVNIFDLERVVIGGGLVTAGDLLLDPIRRSFERFVFAREHRRLPILAPARLGHDAGWIGAGMLALDTHAATVSAGD